MLRWSPKDPDDVDFRVHDWTKRLYNEDELAQYYAAIAADPSLESEIPSTVVMPSDTVSLQTFILPSQVGSANPLIAVSATNTATRAQLKMSGGVDRTNYEIVSRANTVGGRQIDETIKMKVKTR